MLFAEIFQTKLPIILAAGHHSGRMYLESVIIRDETLVFLLFRLFINDVDISILDNGLGS